MDYLLQIIEQVSLKAIEETDAVAKAWFRRGEAQLALNDCESAKLDFEKSLELEPDNKVNNLRAFWLEEK